MQHLSGQLFCQRVFIFQRGIMPAIEAIEMKRQELTYRDPVSSGRYKYESKELQTIL